MSDISVCVVYLIGLGAGIVFGLSFGLAHRRHLRAQILVLEDYAHYLVRRLNGSDKPQKARALRSVKDEVP